MLIGLEELNLKMTLQQRARRKMKDFTLKFPVGMLVLLLHRYMLWFMLVLSADFNYISDTGLSIEAGSW